MLNRAIPAGGRAVGKERTIRSVKIGYRPAAPDDYDFLYQLHRAAMQRYVVETWGRWDEDWQELFFRENLHLDLQQVITTGGEDVGVLEVQERAEELFIVLIEILPEYQGRGIGSQVLNDVIARAGQDRKPVALRVLKVNIRARDLYQRLGFGVTGETETHYIMARGSRSAD